MKHTEEFTQLTHTKVTTERPHWTPYNEDTCHSKQTTVKTQAHVQHQIDIVQMMTVIYVQNGNSKKECATSLLPYETDAA